VPAVSSRGRVRALRLPWRCYPRASAIPRRRASTGLCRRCPASSRQGPGHRSHR
jgi:hypothetical protein